MIWSDNKELKASQILAMIITFYDNYELSLA